MSRYSRTKVYARQAVEAAQQADDLKEYIGLEARQLSDETGDKK